MTYGFVVDGRLHRLRLKDTLEKLISSHWKILGARIGKDKQGQYEYRVPSIFNEETEPMTFDYQIFSTPLSNHFQMPLPTAEPSVFPPSSSTIFQPPPHLRQEDLSLYESVAQPVLHLQIAQFSDEKTSVGLTIPHCFCDAQGMKEILAAWSNIMSNAGSVPDIVDDPRILEKVSAEVAGQDDGLPGSLWAHHIPGVPATTSYSNDLSSEEVQEESRWIFMPAEFLARMTQECRDELKLCTEYDVEVSEWDVLVAWWAKAVYSTKHPKAQLPPLAVCVPLNLRDRLPALANPIYLHNAIHMSTHIFPSSASLAQITRPQLALTFRRTVLLATTQEITQTLMHKTQLYYSTVNRSTVATHFPPGAEEFVLCNWLDMTWASEDWLDFQPAVMDKIDMSQSFQSRRGMGRGRGRRDATREKRTPEKIGSGKILWANVDVASRAVQKPKGIAVRKDENGIWIRFTLANWRWKIGALADMAERK
ncbi:hypothetical protein B0H11DRAFT_1102798 [Mycena galericulata]|nr:hypothetical protein B0H11DRAFT_1102798 [Mycena galericulata]